MNKKISILSIVLVVLLLINISLAYFLFHKQNITVSSSNNNYRISYHPTKDFSKLLNDWKVFEVSNQIELELTNKPQATPGSGGTNVLTSSSISPGKNSIIVKVYLSEHAGSLPGKSVNNIVFQQFISKLFTITHQQVDAATLNSQLIPITNKFVNNPQLNPFNVTYIK